MYIESASLRDVRASENNQLWRLFKRYFWCSIVNALDGGCGSQDVKGLMHTSGMSMPLRRERVLY